jgi:hypothetical protein
MYGAFLGDRFTAITPIEFDWISPMRGGELAHVEGSVMFALGSDTPIELFSGPEGSPWYTPSGTQFLHHVAYWGDPLTAMSKQLEDAGFEIEFTMPPTTEGEVRGFAYHLHPSGFRIELQTVEDKAAMARWWSGEDLSLAWEDQH